MSIITKIFGTYSEKEIKRVIPTVDKIESLEVEMKKLSDDQLRAKTDEFKERIKNGGTLDSIMAEAFAVVREAAIRANGQRPFRVQLLGGLILHQGRISEMRTGEGKTITATLPAYLNALEGKGVHIVTVNDYLAKTQSEEMARIHNFLGLSVGCILHDLTPEERREAYACDITYATNNELGFDYLRDNMVVYQKDLVLRGLHYAIIDEVDSILIDEARTPLIISGDSGKSTQLYKVADTFVKGLKKGKILNEQTALNAITREDIKEEGDFVTDEKQKTTNLTQEGIAKAEKFFAVENLSDAENLELSHHITNALKANYNMALDQDYIVKDGQIIIVDEFTGRPMEGRRYSDGLHQAIEAKENVDVKRENRTLATITFQNFFNKYTKKSGMTGTALTEEAEFKQIYGMDVVVVPTNMPMIRQDMSDIVYKTETEKLKAVVEDIVECHHRGQPVLVGTLTIEKSELISSMLKKKGIKNEVLNAKYLAKEAEIVALAGQRGAVTIATNMAGRGTDIKLGEGVVELGGLKIIGTERHESRRIDNQLRGRAGRQGDPGMSRFYVSFDDDLMRIFGSDKMKNMVTTLGLRDDEPIENKMLTRSIENAQKRVEGNNFSIRKHLLDYDQVMNRHREMIYKERRKVLDGLDLSESIMSMIEKVISHEVSTFTGVGDDFTEWDFRGLAGFMTKTLGIKEIHFSDKEKEELTKKQLTEQYLDLAKEQYKRREEEFTSETMREIERIIMLQVVDQKWMSHIDEMEQVRHGITLQSYAQKDPLIAYQLVADDMFSELLTNIQMDTVKLLFNVRIATKPEKREQVAKPTSTNLDATLPKTPVKRKEAKVMPNDTCPCGSGQKYKHCHGKNR